MSTDMLRFEWNLVRNLSSMEKLTYTFAEVMGALARLNRIPEAGQSAFRAKLQNFQRIGMVSISPGKGKKINYTQEDALKWAFAIELNQFGVDPTIVKSVLEQNPGPIDWQGRSDQQRFYFFHPTMIGRNWPDEAIESKEKGLQTAFSISHFAADSFADISGRLREPNLAGPFVEAFMARHGTIDMHYLRRRVNEELAK